MKSNKKIKSILCAGLVIASLSGFSQTTINAASNSAIIDGNIFDYSIGEMTLVSTERNANIIVTQGYLQPNAASSSSPTDDSAPPSSLANLANKVSVYPNPTENILYIEMEETSKGSVSLQLLDATGKIVLRKTENFVEGNNKYSLDLSAIAAGNYYLLLRNSNAVANKELSYKIQKAH